MKTKLKFLSLIMILILAVSAFAPATVYAAGTTVVRNSNVGADWFTALPAADTRTGGNVSFVMGPATAPIGIGSLQMTTTDAGGSSQAKAQAITGAYVGTPLSSITSLSYYTYRDSVSTNTTAQTISLNIAVDFVGDGSSFTTLVFEPVYQPGGVGAMQLNTWQLWDAYAGGNAIWWSTKPISGVCDFNCFVTWSTILANNPNAKVNGILGFSVGSGWAGQFKGAADALTIGVGADSTTYDFEPEPPCTTVCYVDAVNGNDANGGASMDDAKKTIQAAIDSVNAGGEVRVLPGNYNEKATNRYVLGTNGPHQFGLFIDKNGISVQGVDSNDVDILDYNAAQAYITTNATNNFGTSGIFVQGDGVTLAGLHIGPNLPGDNKTIEITGDEFTLKDSYIDVPGGGSIYFNDWQFDNINNVSHVQTYTIAHNLIDQSTSIDISSGAGYSGPASGRKITNNVFENSEYWPSISFNGSGTGVPWFVKSVGGAVIQGNTFTNTFNGVDISAAHIRVRGMVDPSQFDWNSYWTGNEFNKAVVTLESAPFNVRQYNYTSGSYSFDVRRIGVKIQSGIDRAVAGDTVLVKSGTYVEQLVVSKSLTLLGESGADTTIIKAPVAMPIASNPDSTIVKIAGSGVSVDMSGFTVTGPGPGGCGSIGVGIFVRDNAYANIHSNRILDIRDNPFSGCQNGVAIQVGRTSLNTNGSADITDNVISGYQKNGITVSNAQSWATIENNTVIGAGATSTIAQNGIQYSGGAAGTVNGNTVSNHSYAPGTWTSTGILLYGANVDTYGNTINENQVGVYHIDGSGIHEANILNVSSGGTQSPYFYGIIVDAPPPGLNPAPFEDEITTVAAPISLFATFSSSVQDVDILNNELTGDGTSAGYGIGAYAGYGALDIDLTVKNNKLVNFGTGLDIYQCTGISCTSSIFSNLDVNLNSITGNKDYGLINTQAAMIEAEANWWGSASGPQPAGTGDLVSGSADFTPWLCTGTDTSADTGFQPTGQTDCSGPIVSDVTVAPSPVYLNAATTLNAVANDVTTGGSNIASAEYKLNSGNWLPMLAVDGTFDESNEAVTANFMAATLGSNQVCVRATDAWGNLGPESCATFTVTYVFTGFFQPIDMQAVNIAKAGQAIPVKWRLTDANGVPVSDPTVFVTLVSYSVSCGTFTGDPMDTIETYSGASGLQYLGDGYWQFNWKTPKTYVNTCRKMYIKFQGFTSPEVDFKFK